MTIEDAKKFVASLWDWGFLDDCFSDGARVTDIDGTIERKDWLLIIETKGPEVALKTGQKRTFAAQVKRGATVLILWGEANKPEKMQVWYPWKAGPRPVQETDVEGVKDFVHRWWVWADTPRMWGKSWGETDYPKPVANLSEHRNKIRAAQ